MQLLCTTKTNLPKGFVQQWSYTCDPSTTTVNYMDLYVPKAKLGSMLEVMASTPNH